jgi:glucokinase
MNMAEAVCMAGEAVLSIDIGGSKLSAGFVGIDGAVLYREKSGWTRLEGGSVVRTVLETADRLLKKNTHLKAACIGVNIPGLADTEQGLWVEACFSGIRNIPVAKILSDRYGLPVYIDNDVNNCVLAEKIFGICRGCTDFVWMTVSNGCGGGLFLNNRLYRGVSNSAGEIGHIRVEEKDGYTCGCGNRGCLEAQAAGPGIVRRYLDSGGKVVCKSAREIAALARTGDPAALEVFRMEGCYIGKALSAVINTLNPQKAVIGGGVSEAFDLFYPGLIETFHESTYREASKHVTIEKTGLGGEAALIGAAALALTRTNTVSF